MCKNSTALNKTLTHNLDCLFEIFVPTDCGVQLKTKKLAFQPWWCCVNEIYKDESYSN